MSAIYVCHHISLPEKCSVSVGEFPPAAVALNGLRSELRSPLSTQYVIVLYNIGNYEGEGEAKPYITGGSVSENVNFTLLLPSKGVSARIA